MHPEHPGSRVFARTLDALAVLCAALVLGAGCVGEMGEPPAVDGEEDEGSTTQPSTDDVGQDPDSPIGDDVGTEECADNVDNNGDEFVDCLDPLCDCEPEVCTDNLDNDGDGFVDCLDPQCDCGTEDCGDNLDNDGDGLIDCLDPQCGCEPENCIDDLDNDGDGLNNCFDPECECEPEICDDNIDNDLDGAIDCADPECDCTPEVCFDQVDNDGDGYIDCTATPDPECPCDLFAEGCRPSTRVAFLRCDNDASASVLPAGYDVTTFTCPEVLAAPHLLNAFDTIAYFGGGSTIGGWGGVDPGYSVDAMVAMLTLLYTAGRKVVIVSNPDMSYLSVGDIATHYHSLAMSASTITVTSSNAMTAGFVQAEQMDTHIVQFHSDSADWCGDLFFEQPGFNGHFHGFRRDTDLLRGLVIYYGIYSPTSDVVDFANRFMAANLTQQWNPGFGLSVECGLPCDIAVGHGVGKPVIYLYPEEEQEVTVQLDFEGQLVTTYPEIDEEIGGWDVIARPDGTLTDVRDGHEYSYIFWNGVSSSFVPQFDEGFVVRGEDTVEFLQAKLAEIGLRPYEYNEMIVYWLPYMEHHRYNLIHFAGTEYTDIARMTITPEPDSLLRVFMVFRELESPVSIPEQTFEPFVREGFTAVEWGGSEIGGDWHVVR
jgi:hypothetical protein